MASGNEAPVETNTTSEATTPPSQDITIGEIVINRTGMHQRPGLEKYDPASVPSDGAAEHAEEVAETFRTIHQHVAKEEFSPEHEKTFKRRFSIKQAAEMVGRTPSSIRHNESLGKIPSPSRDPKTNRREPYSLDQINEIRDFFGTRPGRADNEMPACIAFQNFKGGCGKSTLAVHCAQNFALKGYRVLFIDCDPQGSASEMFGKNPELDVFFGNEFGSQPSLNDYLNRDTNRFSDLVVPSYFPGINIIPASFELFEAEYGLAAAMAKDQNVVALLRQGIETVWDEYDFVILDPPPALGMLSTSVYYAATAMITPTRPTLTDVLSTEKFYTMLAANLRVLEERGFPVSYTYHLLCVNTLSDTHSSESIMNESLNHAFTSSQRLDTHMVESAEIGSAMKQLDTVYDLAKPTGTRRTYRRCVDHFDKLFKEIETRHRRAWPSNRDDLRQELAL